MDRIFLSSAFRRTARTAMLVIAVCAGLAVLFFGLIDPTQHRGVDHIRPTGFRGRRDQRARRDAAAQHRGLLLASLGTSRRNLRISAALDNMTQGLCMFDAVGPADPLQRALPRDVRPDAQASLPRRHACANCSNSGKRTEHFTRTSMNTSRAPSAASSKARCSTTSSRCAAGPSRSTTGRSPAAAGSRPTRTFPSSGGRSRNADLSAAQDERRAAVDAAIARVPSARRDHAEDGRRPRPGDAHDRLDAVRGVEQGLAARGWRRRYLERSVDERRDRGRRCRGTVGVDRRDQPAAQPDQRRRQHRRGGSRIDQRPDRLARAIGAEDRRRGQADPGRRRDRPTCSRSMPPSKPPAPARPAAASPSSPRR